MWVCWITIVIICVFSVGNTVIVFRGRKQQNTKTSLLYLSRFFFFFTLLEHFCFWQLVTLAYQICTQIFVPSTPSIGKCACYFCLKVLKVYKYLKRKNV